jgi:predicted dehydrogenase
MPAAKKLKAGIIGCGDRSIGGYFPVVSEAYDLVAACDVVKERAVQMARIFEADAAYSGIDEMLDKSKGLDIVIILTSMASHGEIALKSVQAGKHVMLQKPFCTDMETGLEVVRIAKQKNLKIIVEPNYWVNPMSMKAKEILGEGHIGKVHVALARTERGFIPLWGGRTFYEEAGGGMLFDMGVYQVSHLAFLLGPATKVSGTARLSIPERPPVYPDDHFTSFLKTYHAGDDPTGYWRTGVGSVPANNQVYDNTFTLIEWPGDLLGCVISNSVSMVLPPPGAALVLCGDKGTIAFGRQGATSRLSVGTTDTSSPYHVAGTGTSERERVGWFDVPDPAAGSRPGPASSGQGYLRSMYELRDAIANDTQPHASMDWGLHVAEIMIKSNISAETGRARRLVTKF